MSKIAEDRRYAKSHEWAMKQDDGTVTVGISDHAQEALGDLVFVETPAVGRKLKAGESCAVVESVKAASDIYAPITGEVIEVNDKLADQPELLNQDPCGEGWLWKMKPTSADEVDSLLDAAAYAATLDNDH